MTPLPRHGTPARYLVELREKNVCDLCRAANTAAKRRQRERDRQRDGAVLSLVPDGATAPSARKKRTPTQGYVERAVRADLRSVGLDTPFFNSVKAALVVLARELDDPASKAAKSNVVKQLMDTVRVLRGTEGDGGAVAGILGELAAPLTGVAAVSDEEEPG